MKLICSCPNPDCQEYQKEREIEWDGCSSYKLLLLTKCPSCGQSLTTKPKESMQENKLITIASPAIDSMTPAQRKILLKERSNRDFKKNIEAQKREMDKNIVPRH